MTGFVTKMVSRLGCFILAMGISIMANGQVNKVEPPNWWVGFKSPFLQLLLHGKELTAAKVTIDYKGVKLLKVHRAGSPNYLFLDLEISPDANPGEFAILLAQPTGETFAIPYELREREARAEELEGFGSKDVIYLITPDRFSNGSEANDSYPGLREQGTDRLDNYARHGGDIEGITNHLDYISEMGFTTIWPSPMLINDMPEQSYHGYAITDFYRVDPRFGTLAAYKHLANQAGKRGIKLIMDQVVNHCGLYHWWMDDLPFRDWINFQDEIGKDTTVTTNHRRTTNQDPYAADADKELMEKGWFVSAMPDLNQRNPMMAHYLIQNSLWWIETLSLGGIRQDTYPYPDKEFLSTWAHRIMTEFPNFSIVGEEWSYNPLLVGYWQQGAANRDGYQSHLKSTMDFPLQRALVESLNEPESWDSGLNKLYEALANDFYYARPQEIMLFPDNHDMDRIFTQLEEDIPNTEMAVAYVALAPRIPQFYYGTEILMENTAEPGDHGLIRSDMPGGWKGDKTNAFTGKNLSAEAGAMKDFMKKLLNFRKSSGAVHRGKTIHFSPENGIYFMFRILDDEIVVLILNKNEQPVSVNLGRFREVGLDGLRLKNVLTGTSVTWGNELQLDNRGAYILSR